MSKGSKRRPGKIPPGEWDRIFGKKRLTAEDRERIIERTNRARARVRDTEALDFNDDRQNRDRFNRHYYGEE